MKRRNLKGVAKCRKYKRPAPYFIVIELIVENSVEAHHRKTKTSF